MQCKQWTSDNTIIQGARSAPLTPVGGLRPVLRRWVNSDQCSENCDLAQGLQSALLNSVVSLEASRVISVSAVARDWTCALTALTKWTVLTILPRNQGLSYKAVHWDSRWLSSLPFCSQVTISKSLFAAAYSTFISSINLHVCKSQSQSQSEVTV